MKKNLIGLFTGVAVGGLVTQAQAAEPFAYKKTNSNAIVQTFLEKVDLHAGKTVRPLPYTKQNGASLVCAGDIPSEINALDDKGQAVYMKPLVPEIVRFAHDPNAKDKNGQTKIKTLLQTRKDLAYLEFTSVMGPTEQQINAYLKDVLKHDAIDLYQGGTGLRDGSVRTTLLIDRKAIDNFTSENGADIRKTEEKLAAASSLKPHTFSACGLKEP